MLASYVSQVLVLGPDKGYFCSTLNPNTDKAKKGNVKALQLVVLDPFTKPASSLLTLLMAAGFAEASPRCSTENG